MSACDPSQLGLTKVPQVFLYANLRCNRFDVLESFLYMGLWRGSIARGIRMS